MRLDTIKTSDFDYPLPPELIAQTPAEPRDSSRLLVLHRQTGQREHRRFRDIVHYLKPGDALLLNDTRVLPARLLGRKESGGRAEVLLLRQGEGGVWEGLVRPGGRVKVGTNLVLGEAEVKAEVVGRGEGGTRLLRFPPDFQPDTQGTIPLPPYIHTPLPDPERYQTVYARSPGSAAAPTAGLHFTPGLLHEIEARAVSLIYATLHIGPHTFRPVREEDPQLYSVGAEWGELSPQAALALNQARQSGGRVIAVGTTACRLSEQAAGGGAFQPWKGWCRLFILPGHQFRGVDGLLTNFHLPRSTNLMLAAAFAGREVLLEAYQEAIALSYRFYSFGDCMIIL